MAAETKIAAVEGVQPKKGQLPAGLVKWLQANGRMKRGAATPIKATKAKAKAPAHPRVKRVKVASA